ncbi:MULTISPECIES: Nif11-like leader peptide family RiPP precursor [Prochlorococcus]|uniref:Nif11 domain-containing protein n=1 Tax=Prochlorococcus marinus (strain MIT 9303) TaxID=59922 RepID=A2C958_PROM3|nr:MULTISPECIES: Nif11-like leader peptide family RiPP precursor [Prochlorococcus]ABM78018.1 Hypothetical protein P9303_12711 [Prochlorococcus marinus str. MIT 9303]KZR66290.1 Nitrogen fixation protein of unknown function [Prochlorococcus sp. MIT 1306]
MANQLGQFIRKSKSDASLKAQLKSNCADVVAIAKAHGFVITEEDLNDFEESSKAFIDRTIKSIGMGDPEETMKRYQVYNLVLSAWIRQKTKPIQL